MPPAAAAESVSASVLLTVRLPSGLLRALDDLTQAASNGLIPPTRNRLICEALAEYVRQRGRTSR